MRHVMIMLVPVLLLSLVVSMAQGTRPIADAGPDTTMYSGGFITLHGTAWDPDGDAIEVWQWTLVEGPMGHGDLTNADMPDAGFFALEEGAYLLSLYVVDSQLEQSAADSMTVDVVWNTPPTAIAVADVNWGTLPLTVHFDGTGSSDPEGRPLTYHWDFGDGYDAVGPTPAHTYDTLGEHFVDLMVIDDGGEVGFDSIIITGYFLPLDIVCPPDMTIASFSTLPLHVLSGFRIWNPQAITITFSYDLSTEGPATLVDNGDPASLSGTVTVGPHGSYGPPAAALEIPAIREPAQVVVTYHVISDVYKYAEDWRTTTITLESPVPVFVTQFDAVSVRQGVELAWNVISDEDVKGFTIYRSIEGSKTRELVNQESLVPPDVRRYVDNDVRAGHAYDYTLGVVLNDDYEMMSQTVTVKTKAYELALRQNHPNPFNPTTEIGFSLDREAKVSLQIYDISGKHIRTLVDRKMIPDSYSELWDGRDNNGGRVASGVYFYRLTSGGRSLTKKMVLLK